MALKAQLDTAGFERLAVLPFDSATKLMATLDRIALVSLLIGAGTIAVFLFDQARGYSYGAAQTMAVNTLVLGQVFYLLNSRYLRASSLRRALIATNPVIWLAVGLLALLQIVFVYAPFMNTRFHSAPLAAADWLLPIGIGFGIFLAVEGDKAVARRLARG